MQPPAAHELKLERVLDAPRAKIWRCWSEPELLKQWYCPKPWFVPDVRMDMRPGGEMFTVMNGPDGERHEHGGVFLEIIPLQLIITTDAFAPGWRPSGRPFMTAHVELADADAGRTLYIARAMHWSAEACKEHEQMGFHEGWGKAADQLEALAKSL